MSHKLPTSPNISVPKSTVDLRGVEVYLNLLYRDLIRILSELSFHLNQSLDVSGHDAMTGPLTLATYTVATVPAAADHTGAIIYVSNETGGAVPAFSDGTNWRRVTDRAIIS